MTATSSTAAKKSPDEAEIAEAFAVFSQDDSSVHRKLTTLLYLSPQRWHNIKNAEGDTLLLAAVRSNKVQAVSVLLKKGFSPDAWNNELQTGLHLSKSPVISQMLLSKSPRLEMEADINGDLPLHLALRSNNEPVVKFLLQHESGDAQVLRRNALGQTPLFEAAATSWKAVLQLLLMGSDPRLVDRDGLLPKDYCNDPAAVKKMNAFSAHFDRCDEAAKTDALDENSKIRNFSLGQRAKQFLDDELLSPVNQMVLTAPSAAPV